MVSIAFHSKYIKGKYGTKFWDTLCYIQIAREETDAFSFLFHKNIVYTHNSCIYTVTSLPLNVQQSILTSVSLFRTSFFCIRTICHGSMMLGLVNTRDQNEIENILGLCFFFRMTYSTTPVFTLEHRRSIFRSLYLHRSCESCLFFPLGTGCFVKLYKLINI